MNSKFRSSRFIRACGSASNPEKILPANVIELRKFRNRRQTQSTHPVFYLTQFGQSRESIGSLPWLQVEEIPSLADLKRALVAKTPDLILLEANITWLDPISAISLLSSLVEVPIVMICEPSAKSQSLIKKAFAAGVHDTLNAPLRREDLMESLEVLLKLKKIPEFVS